jgi:hypothetical protein
MVSLFTQWVNVFTSQRRRHKTNPHKPSWLCCGSELAHGLSDFADAARCSLADEFKCFWIKAAVKSTPKFFFRWKDRVCKINRMRWVFERKFWKI